MWATCRYDDLDSSLFLPQCMQLTHFPCLAPSLSPRPLAHPHTRSRLLTRPNRSPTHPCVAHSWSLARLPGCSCFAHPYLMTHSCRTRSYLLSHQLARCRPCFIVYSVVLYSLILPRALLAHTHLGFTRPYSLGLYSPILTWALFAHTPSGFTRPYSLGLYSPILTGALLARLSCRLTRALLARLPCRLTRTLLARLPCRLTRALLAHTRSPTHSCICHRPDPLTDSLCST